MKIFNFKTLAITFIALFTSFSIAHAKVKHYMVAPLIFGDENAKNVVVNISAFSCPYCAKSFSKDFDKYQTLVKSKRIKFIYVPAIIHGIMDLKANQIFYLFPRDKQLPLIHIIFGNQDSWVKTKAGNYDVNRSMKALMQLITENTGLSTKQMEAAFKDKAYATEVKNMSDTYFKMYHATYTPSYILNGKLVGGSTSYNQVKTLLK